ncbi:uncharacterized protein LOC115110923 isoform X1 [Oncorhynchus nerka]|uniref:uncharacterized protein LOC115110923 isoform X1 n=2 Tax=Oncorhynchus nerka TaxID=8023 RepID=UPI0031B8336A
MPTLCSAYNCKNRGPKADVGFFSFPKNDPERRKRWIINMKWKDWNPQHHHRVCSIHFEDKYICRMDKRQRLTPDAVPTIFDFPENFQKKKASIHPQSRRARSDGLPEKYTAAHAVTVAEPVTTPSPTITSETSKLAKDITKAPEKVTSSSWYIHVDEEIQMAESLPGFFHSDYCLPHSIRWGFKDDVAPKVACENMEFQLPPLKHIIEITEAWEWLGMDIRGPLPLTPNGHQYVLTLTDFYSKWVEAFPLRGCSSTEVAQHVAEVISHFGFPFGILVRLKRKFTSKINLALNSHLKLRGFSLLYRHRQVGSLDLATQTLISRMVSDLVKDHPYNWDVCLPAKVFSLCFKEHPKTKQRPFSLLCCKGPQPVTTPRDLSFSPAELRESSFAIQSNQEGGHDTDPQDMVGIESGKETTGKSTITRVSFLRSNTESNNTDGNTYGHPDGLTDGDPDSCKDGHPDANPDGSTEANPDGSTEANPDGSTEANPDGSTEANPDGSTEADPDGSTEADPDGSTEADPDGSTEADPDGLTDGDPDGLTDGDPDGLTDGDPDSCKDGHPDADPDGLTDGDPDSCKDGHPDANPDGSTDANPDGLTDGDPGSCKDGHPDANPDGSTDANPDGSTDANPDGSTDANPDGSTDANPDGLTDADPDGLTDGDPDGLTDGDPDSRTDANPDGSTDANPDGSTDANPDGSTDANPDGSTDANPNNNRNTNSERSSEEHHAMEN